VELSLHLYVILDIFSRYVVGWMVASRESAALAEVLIEQTCAKQDIGRDRLTIHADRGSSMTSKPVAFLLADLGVTKSHSRPHISDDNPFSEAQFKTLKYRPDFPDRSSLAGTTANIAIPGWVYTFLPTCITAPPRSSATSAPACSTLPTPHTQNGSCKSRPNHRNCPAAHGSTDQTTPRRPLSKYRSTVPHWGRAAAASVALGAPGRYPSRAFGRPGQRVLIAALRENYGPGHIPNEYGKTIDNAIGAYFTAWPNS
jgi:transposase InsO family protein